MNRKSNTNSVLRLKHNKESNSKPELECYSVLFSYIAPSLLSRDCKRYDDIIIEKDTPHGETLIINFCFSCICIVHIVS